MSDPRDGRFGPARERDGPVLRDRQARPTATVRIAARDRWPAALSTLIAVFLAIAILKPWVAAVLTPPGDDLAIGPPLITPATSLGPDLLAGLREHCQDPLGWRVYSREVWLGRPVRTWRSVEPATAATGPTDPAIPMVPLGPKVDALGYCSPWAAAERPPDDTLASGWRWTVEPGLGQTFQVIALRPVAPESPSPLGALYGGIEARPDAATASDSSSPLPASWEGSGPRTAEPDPASPGVASAGPEGFVWPAGRYVFALRATGWQRWWSVAVAAPDVVPSGAPPIGP